MVSHAREFLNAVCTDILHLHSRCVAVLVADCTAVGKFSGCGQIEVKMPLEAMILFLLGENMEWFVAAQFL